MVLSMRNKLIQIRVNEREYDKLKKKAVILNTNVSEFVRYLITESQIIITPPVITKNIKS